MASAALSAPTIGGHMSEGARPRWADIEDDLGESVEEEGGACEEESDADDCVEALGLYERDLLKGPLRLWPMTLAVQRRAIAWIDQGRAGEVLDVAETLCWGTVAGSRRFARVLLKMAIRGDAEILPRLLGLVAPHALALLNVIDGHNLLRLLLKLVPPERDAHLRRALAEALHRILAAREPKDLHHKNHVLSVLMRYSRGAALEPIVAQLCVLPHHALGLKRVPHLLSRAIEVAPRPQLLDMAWAVLDREGTPLSNRAEAMSNVAARAQLLRALAERQGGVRDARVWLFLRDVRASDYFTPGGGCEAVERCRAFLVDHSKFLVEAFVLKESLAVVLAAIDGAGWVFLRNFLRRREGKLRLLWSVGMGSTLANALRGSGHFDLAARVVSFNR
jgi:hypothetical protein